MPKSVDEKLKLVQMLRNESAMNCQSVGRRSRILNSPSVNSTNEDTAFFKSFMIGLGFRILVCATVFCIYYYCTGIMNNDQITSEIDKAVAFLIK